MTKFYGAKSTVSVGLLCFILFIETSVVGNAFVFYTGFPRYVAFFACSGLVFLIRNHKGLLSEVESFFNATHD